MPLMYDCVRHTRTTQDRRLPFILCYNLLLLPLCVHISVISHTIGPVLLTKVDYLFIKSTQSILFIKRLLRILFKSSICDHNRNPQVSIRCSGNVFIPFTVNLSTSLNGHLMKSNIEGWSNISVSTPRNVQKDLSKRRVRE